MSSNMKTVTPSESHAKELYNQYIPVPETGALESSSIKAMHPSMSQC